MKRLMIVAETFLAVIVLLAISYAAGFSIKDPTTSMIVGFTIGSVGMVAWLNHVVERW